MMTRFSDGKADLPKPKGPERSDADVLGRAMSPALLTEQQAAQYLQCSRSFLAKSRMDGTLPGHTPGPPWVRLGRAVRYDRRDLERWVDQHRHHAKGAQSDV